MHFFPHSLAYLQKIPYLCTRYREQPSVAAPCVLGRGHLWPPLFVPVAAVFGRPLCPRLQPSLAAIKRPVAAIYGCYNPIE